MRKWKVKFRVCSSSAILYEKQCYTGFLDSLWTKTQSPTWNVSSYSGLTNFTSLTRISGHTMTNIRPNAPSIVQTRDKTAFLFASRTNKSVRTATLIRPNTFSAVPTRRAAYGRQACRSLKSFHTFTNVWFNACAAIVTTSSTKWCFATNAVETFRTP